VREMNPKLKARLVKLLSALTGPSEVEFIQALKRLGLSKGERVVFEVLDDDEKTIKVVKV